MYWYTLTPCDEWIEQRLIPAANFWDDNSPDRNFPYETRAWIADAPLLPNGHEIVAALRSLLQDAIVTLRGPFLCRNNTLYFPSPLNDRTAGTLIPATWIPGQRNGDTCFRQPMPQPILWDSRKPVPLVSIQRGSIDRSRRSSRCSSAPPARPWLSFKAMLQRLIPCPPEATNYPSTDAVENSLENEFGEQPWIIETQRHGVDDENCDRQSLPTEQTVGQIREQTGEQGAEQVIEQTIRLHPDWQFAIALDSATHRRLSKLGKILLIYLGERSQRFWLQVQEQSFQQQWRILQEQSERNRRMAQQRLAQQSEAVPETMPEAARVLAYLATPGVFERKYSGVVTCRNFPWEWDLAYPGDRHQPPGPLVSLATTNPVPISCRCLSRTTSTKGVTGFQVFAVSPGSVYYLEYPADLFQDQPFLKDGRPNKAHLWRRLGYSELFWMPYPNCDTLVPSGFTDDRLSRSSSVSGNLV
ncbi:type III-B CRISPR module-associated Cmr3 family protein [Leptolyngbya ohadii]|uniref:type III-B CRISPR module-associated Cmr3 family protein n=1 Tax=Leptolyngbya ohadii TaxID=1962290 RepID=UPI000B5A17C5|nr:type III-B CRISPR module-associated Cmr3 family protein [Leptolyngbya ohadii]